MIGPKDDPAAAWAALHRVPCILEGFVPFDREISVVAARARDGQVECFDVAENEHRNHILKTSRVPAAISADLATEARRITEEIAQAFDYVGVLAVEMFVVAQGSGPAVLVNEIAPRVHNSGHWTIDGCSVSQFEQHIRAVAGWPLASRCATAGGDDQPDRRRGRRLCRAGSAEPGASAASLRQERSRARPQDGPRHPGDPGRRQGVTDYILAALICFLVGWTVAAAEVLFRQEERPSPFRGGLGMLLLLALAAVGAAFGTGGILWIFRAIPSSAVIVVIGGAGWLGFAASNRLHGASRRRRQPADRRIGRNSAALWAGLEGLPAPGRHALRCRRVVDF